MIPGSDKSKNGGKQNKGPHLLFVSDSDLLITVPANLSISFDGIPALHSEADACWGWILELFILIRCWFRHPIELCRNQN